MEIEAQLREAYQRHAALLARHLERLLGSGGEAWDLVQESFIRYAALLRRGGETTSTYWYLYRIATRLSLRRMRRRQYRRQKLSLLLEERGGTDDPQERAWCGEVLRGIWARLDPVGKVVAQALLLDGMTDLEISRYTGIPRGTVQRRIKKIKSLARTRDAVAPLDKKNGQKWHSDAS